MKRKPREKTHLFIKVYQRLIWQLEGLDGLQDSVPVTAVNVCNKALNTVHGVQRHSGLLLQSGQSPVQIVFFQVLHNQTDHAVENTVWMRKYSNTQLRQIHLNTKLNIMLSRCEAMQRYTDTKTSYIFM